jgi:adenosylcobinamide-GDP ribazoletransferase
MVSALRGAVGVLTRFSAGDDEWRAVRTTPVALPVVGVVVGLIVGITLLVPAPLATPPALYLGTLYLLTGTGSLRGLVSAANSATPTTDEHQTDEHQIDERETVAGLVTVVLVVVVLALGAFSLVGTGGGGLGGLTGASITLSLVVASELSATAGMATLLVRGVGRKENPSDEQDAEQSQHAEQSRHAESNTTTLLPVAVVLLLCVAVVPAVVRPAVVATLVAGVLVALAVGEWARGRRSVPQGAEPSGPDVPGAARELGRVVAVHAGVVVWTLV